MALAIPPAVLPPETTAAVYHLPIVEQNDGDAAAFEHPASGDATGRERGQDVRATRYGARRCFAGDRITSATLLQRCEGPSRAVCRIPPLVRRSRSVGTPEHLALPSAAGVEFQPGRKIPLVRSFLVAADGIACLMTRADVFAGIGGFDEAMPFLWNDIDYCFKVRARSLRVVFSPYAGLYHFETATKSSAFRAEETVQMARVWADQLDRDPFYNCNLRQDRTDFRVVG